MSHSLSPVHVSHSCPLLIAGGTFWPPLAIVIAGGVGGAPLLATVYIPATYVWVGPLVEKDLAINVSPDNFARERITDTNHLPAALPRNESRLEHMIEAV
jgi:hypothetical protein